MTQGPSVRIDLAEIVSGALLRASNDQLHKVEGASAVAYVVHDVTVALRKQNVYVMTPDGCTPNLTQEEIADLVPVADHAEGPTVATSVSGDTVGSRE